MKEILGMLPGLGKSLKETAINDNSFKPTEAIIRSMTRHEKANPDIINISRRKRIADGSGTSIQEVNKIIKQFAGMRKMMKSMNKMGGGKRAFSELLNNLPGRN